jgi:hypothetical protein
LKGVFVQTLQADNRGEREIRIVRLFESLPEKRNPRRVGKEVGIEEDVGDRLPIGPLLEDSESGLAVTLSYTAELPPDAQQVIEVLRRKERIELPASSTSNSQSRSLPLAVQPFSSSSLYDAAAGKPWIGL